MEESPWRNFLNVWRICVVLPLMAMYSGKNCTHLFMYECTRCNYCDISTIFRAGVKRIEQLQKYFEICPSLRYFITQGHDDRFTYFFNPFTRKVQLVKNNIFPDNLRCNYLSFLQWELKWLIFQRRIFSSV